MTSEFNIPLDECVVGNAYQIQSRNLILGVFNGSGFVGIREKFESRYLFVEYHRDLGGGTATPFEDLGPCPIQDLSENHRREWKGDGSDPEWAGARKGKTYLVTNQSLFDWLETKQAEIAVACRGCDGPYWPLPWTDDGFCNRTTCWDARCRPCPTCGNEVLDSDGTQLCTRCTDPLAYDLSLIQALQRLEARRQARHTEDNLGMTFKRESE